MSKPTAALMSGWPPAASVSRRNASMSYDVLLQKRDHPTVEEVFIRAKQGMPDISMATVYNCLDALVKCGLVRHVNLDRAATRYCPNMKEHCHFYCDECGGIFDVDFADDHQRRRPQSPRGLQSEAIRRFHPRPLPRLRRQRPKDRRACCTM